MRKIIPTLLAIFLLSTSCSTVNNKQNQDFRSEVCEASDKFVTQLKSDLGDELQHIQVALVYCGELQAPHSKLGMGIIEVVTTVDGGVVHSAFLLKLAMQNKKWSVIADPEQIIDFAQEI